MATFLIRALIKALRAGMTAGLLLLAPAAEAQLVGNGGFDNTTCNNIGSLSSPFTTGCVPSWRASHGTPQIKGPAGGDMYAYFWAQSGQGEGIFTQLNNLVAGTQYELNFTARGFNAPTMAVKLATNLQAGGGGSAGGSIPTASTVWNQAVYPTTAWGQYTVQLSVPASGNYQLWFYLETATRNSTKYEAHVNDVSFDPADCLTRNVFYQNTTALPASTRTRGLIWAGTAVNPLLATGPARVLSGQNVALVSSQEVGMFAGFSAEPGTTFEAVYGGAGCAVARPADANDWWAASPARPAYIDSTYASSPQARNGAGGTVLYPNPATTELTVQAPDGAAPTQTVIILNAYGREVKRVQVPAGRPSVSVGDLPKGTYFLHTTADGAAKPIRFVVE